MFKHCVRAAALLLSAYLPLCHADALSDDIASLQHGWADAYYKQPEAKKDAAFGSLIRTSDSILARYPGRAEAMVWKAIVMSSAAKFEGGLGALDKIKQARDLLLAAEKVDAKVLDGSIYVSLGSLYAKAPGWPLSFGDKKLGERYLQKALAVNPTGVDPNFFYADLLIEKKDYAEAQSYLQKALAAPMRPGREDADAGRRAEITEALAKVRKHLADS